MKKTMGMLLMATVICSVFAQTYVASDYRALPRVAYKMTTDDLRGQYDAVFVYYSASKAEYIDYAYIVAKKGQAEYVLFFTRPGEVFDRFKKKIVSIDKAGVAGQIVGLPFSFLENPFSLTLMIIGAKGNLKETNPYAHIEYDEKNHTVIKHDPFANFE